MKRPICLIYLPVCLPSYHSIAALWNTANKWSALLKLLVCKMAIQHLLNYVKAIKTNTRQGRRDKKRHNYRKSKNDQMYLS